MSWRAAATTYAGDGAIGFQDGDAKERARFADPFGVAVDSEGNVFVADAGDNNRIRKIAPDGKVGTLAGGQEGYNDGAGVAAQFNTPSALALDREGNVYVADTSNNRIRKVTQTGVVTTLAGDGTPGFRDGAANSAQFNAPLGIAVDERGNVYVADTYNDRVRQITTDGQVKTLAGGDAPGYMDGAAAASLFDTPCSIAVAPNGELFIADTGNDRIRKLSNDGQVTTMNLSLKIEDGVVVGALDAPLGLALTHDGFLYVTESERGRVVQIAPDGTARVLAGAGGSGFADGEGTSARFNNPTGVAVDPNGSVYVADSANYLVRKIVPLEDLKNARPVESPKALPNLSAEILGVKEFVWPVDPPKSPHEVVATMGEVRGSFDGESRHHLHSGIDIQGALGAPVRSVFDEKITRPIADWGFGSLNEGIRVGVMTYIHLRVGRDAKDEPIDNSPFDVLRDADGKVLRVRVKRGTRLRVGDALGTINRMYHVHLNLGPWGAEINPLRLPFVGFGDSIAPTIERDGIQVLDASGQRLTTLRDGRLIVRGDVSIVVDAYDRVDGNLARRRLGLYKLGYQILKADGTPAPGFDEPRVQIEFERMPLEREAVQIAYAESSGITVYGSASTRFLYVVTNTVRDRRAAVGVWRASELPQGDYILRILAADYAGNEATTGRDLPITIE
jgi:sugar lactone lactonase YvrE